MWIILGLILGIIYIAQPWDAIRAPVEWLNKTMVEYTSSGAEWAMGLLGENDATRFFGLLIAVATPGVAGLLLNLIAPLGRMVRVIFSIAILLFSFGAWAVFDWQQALLFNLATVVVGLILSILTGPIMEAIAGFFSITLGASQVRMLITDTPSQSLKDLKEMVASNAGFLNEDMVHWVTIGLGFTPLLLVGAWLVFRLIPARA